MLEDYVQLWVTERSIYSDTIQSESRWLLIQQLKCVRAKAHAILLG